MLLYKVLPLEFERIFRVPLQREPRAFFLYGRVEHRDVYNITLEDVE